MNLRIVFYGICFGLVAGITPNAGWCVDHQVQALKSAAPGDKLSPEIAGKLNETGIQVVRGAGTVVCEIWLCKELQAVEGFKATSELLYPFKPGDLIGAIRFARKSSDFRGQDIGSGVYTMRYAQQPVDGAHVGTSLTRDFLLLVKSEKDTGLAAIESKDLNKRSSDAAGSSHPALLSLQKVSGSGEKGIRHVEDHDWWIVRLSGQLKDGSKVSALPIDLLVVGKAPE